MRRRVLFGLVALGFTICTIALYRRQPTLERIREAGL